MFAGVRQWLKDNPRIVFLVLAGAVILGLFLGVISPLFATTGPTTADLSGVIPATAPPNQRFEVDISIDNTGNSIVQPAVRRRAGPGRGHAGERASSRTWTPSRSSTAGCAAVS